jgi:hypothetical protein
MPFVPRLWSFTEDRSGVSLSELAAPGADGFIVKLDAAHGNQLLYVQMAEAEVESYAVGNNFGWKAIVVVAGVGFAHLPAWLRTALDGHPST